MAKIETSKAGHECSGSLRVKAEPTPPPPPARAKTRPFSSAHVERTCFTNPFSRLFAGCCILHITLLVPFVCPVIVHGAQATGVALRTAISADANAGVPSTKGMLA